MWIFVGALLWQKTEKYLIIFNPPLQSLHTITSFMSSLLGTSLHLNRSFVENYEQGQIMILIVGCMIFLPPGPELVYN